MVHLPAPGRAACAASGEITDDEPPGHERGRRCTIRLAYAIGVSKPLSLYVDTHGTGTVGDDELEEAIKGIEAPGGLTPRGIRTYLGLNKPICRKKTDLIPDLRAALQA